MSSRTLDKVEKSLNTTIPFSKPSMRKSMVVDQHRSEKWTRYRWRPNRRLMQTMRRVCRSILLRLFLSGEHSNWRHADFWKKFTSTPVDKQVSKDAYTLAFDRLLQIYHSLGWYQNDELLFNAVVLSRYSRRALAYRVSNLDDALEQSKTTFEYSNLPHLLTVFVRFAAWRKDALEYRDGAFVNCRCFAADQILKVPIAGGRLRLVKLGGLNEMSL